LQARGKKRGGEMDGLEWRGHRKGEQEQVHAYTKHQEERQGRRKMKGKKDANAKKKVRIKQEFEMRRHGKVLDVKQKKNDGTRKGENKTKAEALGLYACWEKAQKASVTGR